MQYRKLLLPLTLGAMALFAYTPSGASAADLDCGDFSNQAEAQENLLPGDPYGLDGDSDGVACEDLPCPCSTGGSSGENPGPTPPPPPPPPKLDKAAARDAAEHKARKFTRRHARLDSVALQRCGRRGTYKVICRFIARGRTRSQQTTCRFRAVVKGEGDSASATIRGIRCRSRLLIVLSPARAKQAMEAAARQIAKTRVTVYALNRLDSRSFSALGEWTQTSSAGADELCSIELEAEQSPAQSIQVRTRNRDCQEI